MDYRNRYHPSGGQPILSRARRVGLLLDAVGGCFVSCTLRVDVRVRSFLRGKTSVIRNYDVACKYAKPYYE